MLSIQYPSQNDLDEYFNSYKDDLLTRINKVQSSRKIKRKDKIYKVTKQINEILEHLKQEENLKRILIATPKQLIQIIKEVNKYFVKATYSKEALHNILYKIFVDYGYNKIDKLSFINKLDLGSCPYCNRNYIFSVSKKGSVKPEIDHFYPKSLYPYLAASYFNLIPSCPTCNGFGAKEAKDTFHVYPLFHPYETQENDFQFSISPKDISFLNVEVKKYDFNAFEIELYGNKNNLDVFHLEDLYAQHKDVVLELLVKKQFYPQSYIEDLKKFGFSEKEIYRYMFSNYMEADELHKRPLSKLIRDIAKELDLLKGMKIDN